MPHRALFSSALIVNPEECHLKVLRLLQAEPSLSQRDLARALGLSLGKTHYCVRALLDKGLLKMRRFYNSDQKARYAYMLTPAGVAAKSTLAHQFLMEKRQEYDALRLEIEDLQREVLL